jgi:hypothetical protein
MRGAAYTLGMKRINEDDVRAKLLRACEQAGSQKSWAEKNGVSAVYVCDVLQGRRGPGGKILAALGCRRVVLYEEDA